MSKKLLDSSTELKFENTKEVEKQLTELYDVLSSDIEKMKKINTDNVEPMTRVDNSPINFLREDVVKDESLTKEQLLSNAPSNDEDFIIINNGGSHD
ncbi:MAG: glutamyl-tRNA amidotransferase [Mycoplasmataceae bacterium]|nr:glutamyl-tRNA amidotransferase [Mycoplasmataceae bacterium]